MHTNRREQEFYGNLCLERVFIFIKLSNKTSFLLYKRNCRLFYFIIFLKKNKNVELPRFNNNIYYLNQQFCLSFSLFDKIETITIKCTLCSCSLRLTYYIKHKSLFICVVQNHKSRVDFFVNLKIN